MSAPNVPAGSAGGAGGQAPAFSKSEMMIVAAARELAGQRVCFVGVGLPNIAVNLARLTVAPELELVYESGAFGAKPARLPLSIGDPTIVTGATAIVPMFELFSFYLQGGLVDVGFLGAAQIDRFGIIQHLHLRLVAIHSDLEPGLLAERGLGAFVHEPEVGLASLDVQLGYAGFLAADVKDAPGEFPDGQLA